MPQKILVEFHFVVEVLGQDKDNLAYLTKHRVCDETCERERESESEIDRERERRREEERDRETVRESERE